MEIKQKCWQAESGRLPTDWEVLRLGDLARIHDGTHQTPHYVPVGVPFYSVEHVTSGNFSYTKFISEKEHKFLTRSFKMAKGDILMTRIGSVGECRLIDWNVEASFYVSLALLKVHGAHARYVAQYSNSRAFKQEVELHSLPSATPKKINLGPISAIQIAVPPIEEQRAIADVLDDVDALLSALDRLIAKKRDLKQAAMQQLLTGQTRLPGFEGEWKVVRLSDVCSMRSGEGITSADIDDFSLYPCYGGNGLRGYTSRFTHDGGFALIGRQGALCGNVVGVTGRFFASEHAVVVTPFLQTDIRWLTYSLTKMKLNQYSESSAQPGLSVSKVLMLDLHTPPSKDEQAAISAVLSDMDAELTSLEARREKTRLLKLGMMQELLTGKTRLITPEPAHA